MMKDFDEPGHLAPTGLFLGPTKYMVIQGEPGAVIRGKKVMHDCPSPLLISVPALLKFLPYSCSHICVSIEQAASPSSLIFPTRKFHIYQYIDRQ